jgi:hypothetical protein
MSPQVSDINVRVSVSSFFLTHILDKSGNINKSTHANMSLIGIPVCPDLLRLEQIGEADRLRGRIVRLFFKILDRIYPV